MKRQRLQISTPLKVEVQWYDNVPEPPQNRAMAGEIIGWRDTQIIVRVKDYAVIRFWKSNGVEVGNEDHARRGYRIDLAAMNNSVKPAPGINVELQEPSRDSVSDMQQSVAPPVA